MVQGEEGPLGVLDGWDLQVEALEELEVLQGVQGLQAVTLGADLEVAGAIREGSALVCIRAAAGSCSLMQDQSMALGHFEFPQGTVAWDMLAVMAAPHNRILVIHSHPDQRDSADKVDCLGAKVDEVGAEVA